MANATVEIWIADSEKYRYFTGFVVEEDDELQGKYVRFWYCYFISLEARLNTISFRGYLVKVVFIRVESEEFIVFKILNVSVIAHSWIYMIALPDLNENSRKLSEAVSMDFRACVSGWRLSSET